MVRWGVTQRLRARGEAAQFGLQCVTQILELRFDGQQPLKLAFLICSERLIGKTMLRIKWRILDDTQVLTEHFLQAVLTNVRLDQIAIPENTPVASAKSDGKSFLMLAVRVSGRHLAMTPIANDDLLLDGSGSAYTHISLLETYADHPLRL